MIFRWKCNRCGKEIKEGDERLKVIRFAPYGHEGDLCKSCWGEIDRK